MYTGRVFIHFNLSRRKYRTIETKDTKERNRFDSRIIFAIRSFFECGTNFAFLSKKKKKRYLYPELRTPCTPRYNERGKDVTSSGARGDRREEGEGTSHLAVSSLATVASSNGGGCTWLQLGELDERYVYSSNGTRVVAGRAIETISTVS